MRAADRCLAIAPPTDPVSLAAVRDLMLEYARAALFRVDWPAYEADVARLPAGYAAPYGALLLAHLDGAPMGCVGLRRFDDNRCEMKRLYMRPAARCGGVGRALAMAIIDAARALGYRNMVLDTYDRSPASKRLYLSLGFREILRTA